METIRVLIADDHPLVRCGIRETLRLSENIVLVGEASRGDEAQELSRELQPDVLLLDLQMPGATAVATVTYVHEHCPSTRVIILTAYDDEVYVRRMLAEGIDGYILKEEITDAVGTAIRSVMQGGRWLSRRAFEILIVQPSGPQESDPLPSSPADGSSPLTRQQQNVLRLVEKGLTNREIAAQLFISSKTVKKHLEDAYQRLDAHDRETAARIARERGYLDSIGRRRLGVRR